MLVLLEEWTTRQMTNNVIKVIADLLLNCKRIKIFMIFSSEIIICTNRLYINSPAVLNIEINEIGYFIGLIPKTGRTDSKDVNK